MEYAIGIHFRGADNFSSHPIVVVDAQLFPMVSKPLVPAFRVYPTVWNSHPRLMPSCDLFFWSRLSTLLALVVEWHFPHGHGCCPYYRQNGITRGVREHFLFR